MQSLHVEKRDLPDGISLLELAGAIHPGTTGQLSWTLWGLFAEKHYRIILDLSGVAAIDSTGVGILVNATETARENAGDLVLVRPSEKVAWALKMFNLTAFLTMADSREAAEQALLSGRTRSGRAEG